jgi:hypothetical protein
MKFTGIAIPNYVFDKNDKLVKSTKRRRKPTMPIKPDKDQFYDKTFQPVPPAIKKSTHAQKDANTGKGKLPFDGKPAAPKKGTSMAAGSLEELRARHGADGYDGFHAGYSRNNKDGYED